MKINNINSIYFGIKVYNYDQTKLFEDTTCYANDKNKTLCRASIKPEKYPNEYILLINNNNNNFHTPSEELLYLVPDKNLMFVDYMFTHPYYRNSGLGTCLHLLNIIVMLENDINNIDLKGLSTAIPFHVRHGFKIDEKTTDIIAETLNKISKETDPRLEKFVIQAKYILSSKFSDTAKIAMSNELITQYVKESIKFKTKEELKYLLPETAFMTLSKKDIMENKEFYNNLFKKYGIDYEITDSSY